MNYPITTPFGWVAGYPLNQDAAHPGQGFHNGIDYGFPMGTPVVVNGVTIGLSNNTGASTGPHLHVGKYVGGTVQNPGVGNGFSFSSAVVFDTGYDATNGNYVRITGDGALWNYLHMEKVLVSKGQVLKGEDDMIPDLAHLDMVFQRFFGRNSTGDEQSQFIGKISYTQLLDELVSQQAYKDQVNYSDTGFVAVRDNWQAQLGKSQGTVLAPGSYVVK